MTELRRYRNRYALLAAAFCLALACGCRELPEDGSIPLSGTWKLIQTAGDSPARPEYDDAGATEITIPGNWNAVLTGNRDMTATVWLRKRVMIPPSFIDRHYVLSLGRISIADETCVNGHFIGATGEFPNEGQPLKYGFAWHRERTYRIPSEFLRPGSENIIAIRIFSHYLNGFDGRPRIQTMASYERSNRVREHLPAYNNLTPIVLSTILFVFLAIIMKGSGKEKWLLNLSSTLFIICVNILNVLVIGLPRLDNGLTRLKLMIALYAAIDFIMTILVQEFFSLRSLRTSLALFSLLVADLILIAYSPDTAFFIRRGGPAALALVIVFIAYVVAMFITALRKDPLRYWPLAILAVFIISSAANSIYCLLTHQEYRMSFTFALRMPAFLAGASAIMLFDLMKSREELDSMARALLKKTKELRQAKKMSPSAPSKPEPRDVIHELIDYLDNNFNETYDRKGLAKKFGLNEDYMGQIFKRVTGTNIANYINTRRTEAARQLLRETDSRVIDIAFHVGFDNLTYFYRHFRKHTGYSPVEYRRMMRSDYIIEPDLDDEAL